MARLDMPGRETLPDEPQRILEEIESTLGVAPNLFRTCAVRPPPLRANWGKMKAAMMEGELPRRLNSSTRTTVAATAWQRILRASSGWASTTTRSRRSARDGSPTPTSRPYAVAGTSDSDILEAYAVMETFLAFNRFLDSVDVELG